MGPDRAWHALRRGADRAGQWIAWSPDGSRIGAGPVAPEDGDDRGRTPGADPPRAMVAGILAADATLDDGGFGPSGS
jgi:hypothetical protein